MKSLILILPFLIFLGCGLEESGQKESKVRRPYRQLPISKEALKIQQALKGKVKILLPLSFKAMSEAEILTKYPRTSSIPQEAFSNTTGTVSLAFNHTTNRVKPSDLSNYKEAFTQQFKSTLGIDFKGSSLRQVNGKEFVILKFISPAVDTNIYNVMFLTSVEDRLLLCTFNCVVGEMQKWEPIAEQILSSVEIVSAKE